jgi:uncharacterized protein YndB with AHSA1/START domain
MRSYDSQAVEIVADRDRVFEYVADPAHLPEWTLGFREVGPGWARLETPRGTARVGLETEASRRRGTIDWRLSFPDGSVARAISRVVGLAPGRSVYTFLLLPPPAALEAVEGGLAEQSAAVGEELRRLRIALEGEVSAGR